VLTTHSRLSLYFWGMWYSQYHVIVCCKCTQMIVTIFILMNSLLHSHVNSIRCHVRWVLCHHDMARPQVADGGDALQVWRVGANILNKQSWITDRSVPPNCVLGVRLTTPHCKKLRTWTDSFKRPKRKKMNMRFGLGMLEVYTGRFAEGSSGR
jgi:hypothetical protein